MKNYLAKKVLWEPTKAKKNWRIKNALVYQDGFSGGISGHVDVFSRGVSGESGYLYHTRKEITTYYW